VVQSRFAETRFAKTLGNPNFDESGFGESGRHQFRTPNSYALPNDHEHYNLAYLITNTQIESITDLHGTVKLQNNKETPEFPEFSLAQNSVHRPVTKATMPKTLYMKTTETADYHIPQYFTKKLAINFKRLA